MIEYVEIHSDSKNFLAKWFSIALQRIHFKCSELISRLWNDKKDHLIKLNLTCNICLNFLNAKNSKFSDLEIYFWVDATKLPIKNISI